MRYEVWKTRKGYAVGKTSVGDLFLGYVRESNGEQYTSGVEFFKDTEDNRKFVMGMWELNKKFA